jgi:mitochondrial fission protein ELM1
VLALAEALGLPFEQKILRFNHLRHFQPSLLGATLKSVAADARKQLEGGPPDLTISTGQRSVPAVRALKERSGGRMRAVHLGYPRLSPKYFDLVVPTPEYPVPDGPNVVRIPFALSPHVTRDVDPTDSALVTAYPAPRRLFLIGGPTLYWKLPVRKMVTAVSRLIDAAGREGGSIIAVGSPRTPPELLTAIRSRLERASVPFLFVPGDGPPAYASLVAGADAIFVTADSVAMVADAVTTGKPVGLVAIAKSGLGRFMMALMDRLRPGKRLFPRDLRFFWAALEEHGFAGTIDAPKASGPPDYAKMVAEKVRQLLAQPDPPATCNRDSGR